MHSIHRSNNADGENKIHFERNLKNKSIYLWFHHPSQGFPAFLAINLKLWIQTRTAITQNTKNIFPFKFKLAFRIKTWPQKTAIAHHPTENFVKRKICCAVPKWQQDPHYNVCKILTHDTNNTLLQFFLLFKKWNAHK